MTDGDGSSAQSGEAMRNQINGAAAVHTTSLEHAKKTPTAVQRRRKGASAQRRPSQTSTPPASILDRGSPSFPVESAMAREESQRTSLRYITPRVPAPGALAEVYQSFLQEWERTHTLPLNPVYRPSFDLASLSLDALSTADEIGRAHV